MQDILKSFTILVDFILALQIGYANYFQATSLNIFCKDIPIVNLCAVN